VSRYQKGKTNLDFTGARDNEWLDALPAPDSEWLDALPATQPTAPEH